MLQLAIPFFMMLIVLFFESEFVAILHSQLPAFEKELNDISKKKADKYLQLGKQMDHYNTTVEMIQKREHASESIVQNVLYEKGSVEALKQDIVQKAPAPQVWKLQAVFPKHNAAIINAKYVRVGSFIDNAKVVKIEFDSLLLQTNKGLKWVYLFQ